MNIVRTGFIVLIAIFCSASSHSQDVHPAVQALVTDMSIWIDQELSIKGSIDTAMLRRKSDYIKHVQDSVAQIPASAQGAGSLRRGGVVFTKSLMAGGTMRVPDGVVWTILGVYIKNENDPYRIKVTSWNYKTEYASKEYIHAPGTVSEDALMEGDSQDVTYDFDISETPER